jgi:hypothetical protein
MREYRLIYRWHHESFTEHVSNLVIAMSQNAKKKALSVAALLLCYPVNEGIPRLRRKFVGAERGVARNGTQARKLAKRGVHR